MSPQNPVLQQELSFHRERRVMASRSLLALLPVLALLAVQCSAFYLPGVAPQDLEKVRREVFEGPLGDRRRPARHLDRVATIRRARRSASR